jgi:3-methyladenine DNA glycosylase Mpg
VGDTGADLTRGHLTIRPPRRPADFDTVVGPRIGITRSAELPLRFRIAANPFVSR